MNTNIFRPSTGHARSLTFSTLALTASFGALVLGGCHKGSVAHSVSGLTPGTVAQMPNQSGGLAFMVMPNSGGRATTIHLTGIRWGRLADIRDGQNIPRHLDFVVDEGVTSSEDYLVEVNPITEKTTITILSPYSELAGSPYVTKLALLEADLTVLEDKSLDPAELPPFPLVPRNAALVLEFDDLLDPASINPETIKVLTGYPPTVPFDARLIPDPNHGDLADFDGVPGLEYYATRVVVDTTVSSIEAGSTNPPLPVNSLGLPASLTIGQPNIVFRIPTRLDPESDLSALLGNPTHHTLDSAGNGSINFESPTRDIVRALRSGGGALGDVNNGFLVDTVSPSVLGTQAVDVKNLVDLSTAGTYLCDLQFLLSTCANRLAAGDVIQQGSVFAEVICNPASVCPPDSFVTGGVSPIEPGLLGAVYLRVIPTDPNAPPQVIEQGPAQLSMRYTPNTPAGMARCFVRFPSILLPPDQGVAPTSSVIVRFTEPVDPVSMKPFDTMMVLRKDPTPPAPTPPPTLTPYDFVVGSIGASADSREFTFTPALPLNHTPGTADPYWVRVLSGSTGVKDLAGNALATALPAVNFRLDTNAALQNTSGFALRFWSSDELAGVGGDTGTGPNGTGGIGKREFRGQLLLNTESQVLFPRPVTHFSANVDRFQPAPGFMTPSAGTQTPLSKLGSKMQTLWRYFDAGLTLQEESNFNIDIEGLSWAPIASAAVADNFSRFEMSLSHCLRLPDETYDPMAMAAVFPNSGIVAQYSMNLLDGTADPLRTVYPQLGGPAGYAVIPTDIFQSGTGTKFMPWPLNRGIPTKNFVFYTWRDTALLTLGGALSTGANPLIWYQVNGIPPPTIGMPPMFNPIFQPGAIPSFGMPLLMEFRCYPDDDALGLNVFDVSAANPPGIAPIFRAFSTGGVNTQNQIVRKDPDVQTVATGGFNPASTPLPGATTPPIDNTFYMGQLNLVTRVSRVHSIWFDSTSGTVIYSPPVIEPRPNEQPAGTSIVIDYRGSTQLTTLQLLTDAASIDAYGNPTPTTLVGPVFLNNDSTWKGSLTELNGARFFQVRLSYISNAETNLSPGASSLGFAYRR